MYHFIYIPAVFAAGVVFHAAVSKFLKAKSAKLLAFVKKEEQAIAKKL